VHTRVALSCGAVLVLITFLLIPSAGAQSQSPAGFKAEAEIQPTGEIEHIFLCLLFF
jgi:hypothetical protein